MDHTANAIISRSFTVKIKDQLSMDRKQKAGVPQGSVLGPFLFNIYMAGIPKLRQSKIAQFADDTAMYPHSRYRTTLARKLTTARQMVYHLEDENKPRQNKSSLFRQKGNSTNRSTQVGQPEKQVTAITE